MDILLIPMVVIAIGVLLFGSRRVILRMFVILGILLVIPGGLFALWYYQNSPSTAVVASVPERYDPDASDDPDVAAGLRLLNAALGGPGEQRINSALERARARVAAEQNISGEEYARRVWQATAGRPFGVPVSLPPHQ